MVTKIRNLSDWSPWQFDKRLPLPKDKSRTVRIEFIAQAATELRVFTEAEAVCDGAGQLVDVIPFGGHHVLEFSADGNILVQATSDGELLFYCSENDQWWFKFDGEVSFTKPYERPLVDPAYRAMQIQMMRNMQAMEARMTAAVTRARRVEPPVVASNGEVKPDAGDSGAATATPSGDKQAGEVTSAGAEVKPAAKGDGSGVQPASTAKGG